MPENTVFVVAAEEQLEDKAVRSEIEKPRREDGHGGFKKEECIARRLAGRAKMGRAERERRCVGLIVIPF